jgi:hypothetical protein
MDPDLPGYHDHIEFRCRDHWYHDHNEFRCRDDRASSEKDSEEKQMQKETGIKRIANTQEKEQEKKQPESTSGKSGWQKKDISRRNGRHWKHPPKKQTQREREERYGERKKKGGE